MGEALWFRIGGAVMLLWAAANTVVSMSRYGIESGMYWWFCNLAMIGVGFGLLARHRGWLVGFLAIASFTQTFWIIDNLWRVATGENLLGLVEFMYHPGNPLDEFLLSHYHFFIIPTGVLGLLLLDEKRNLSTRAVIATNAVIFGMSYFVFPREQNVNCIHEPCVMELSHWGGPLWAVLFSTAVCAGCIALSRTFQRLLDRVKLGAQARIKAVRVYVAVCVLALGLTALDLRARARVPHFSCGEPVTDNGVVARCRYTQEYDVGVMSLIYVVENTTDESRLCHMFLQYGAAREAFGEPHHLAAKQRLETRTPLSYPKQDTTAKVVAECGHQAPLRDVAHEVSPEEMRPGPPGN